MQGVFSNANEINLFVMMFPHMRTHSKLGPVQYCEYDNGSGFNGFAMSHYTMLYKYGKQLHEFLFLI